MWSNHILFRCDKLISCVGVTNNLFLLSFVLGSVVRPRTSPFSPVLRHLELNLGFFLSGSVSVELPLLVGHWSIFGPPKGESHVEEVWHTGNFLDSVS